MIISIIMPVNNAEKYLYKSIESILNQTYKKFELIIIENNSSDNSKKIIESYCLKDNRIKFITTLKKGVSNARNLGLEVAKGDFVTFIDADDYIESNALQEMVTKVKGYKVDVCMAGYIEESRKNSMEVRLQWDEGTVFNNDQIKKNIIPKMIAAENNEEPIMGSVWRLLIKRTILEENSIRFNEKLTLAEDLLVCIEIFSNADSLVITDECYYHYIRYGNTTLDNFKKDFLGESLIFFNAYKDVLDKCNIFETNKNRFFISKINMYTIAISNLYRWNSPKIYKYRREEIKKIYNLYISDYDEINRYVKYMPFKKRLALELLRLKLFNLLGIFFNLKERKRIGKR